VEGGFLQRAREDSPPKANAEERYRRQRDRSVTAGTPNAQLQSSEADEVATGGEEVLPMTARHFESLPV
jgi:hypothetical protein